MAPVNSCRKGKRGELQVRDLVALLWPEATRGATQGDGAHSCDVERTPFWIESKNGVIPNVWRALEQATRDGRAEKDPRPPVVVAHRTRGSLDCRGLVAFREEDFARVALLFAEGVAQMLRRVDETEKKEDDF